jgi:Panthothenate synthetase
MRTVETVKALRAAVARARASGARIGFVPTMGFLHDGHLSLVDEAKRRTQFVVMSIFVNPLQFGPTEDLANYPRDAAGDGAKAAAHLVDVLFVPTVRRCIHARLASRSPRGSCTHDGRVRCAPGISPAS